MLAFVGINFVIFLIISIQIRKLSESQHQFPNKFNLSNVRSLMAFVTALGLAWIFVLLTYIDKPVIMKNCFETLFVVCNSLQGFMLYYFYCISKAEIRAYYLELFDYRPFSQTPTLTGNSARRTIATRNSIVGNHQIQSAF